MVGSRRVKSPSRGRLERRFEKVRGRHKNSLTGWGSLKNHLPVLQPHRPNMGMRIGRENLYGIAKII